VGVTVDGNDRNALGLLPAQDAKGDPGSLPGIAHRRVQPAADDPVTERVLVPAVDRSVGHRGDWIERVEWHDSVPGPIVGHTQVENDRVWRQLPYARLQVRDGETRHIMERDASLERFALRLEEIGVEPVERRNPADDEDLPGRRLGCKCRRQRAREVDCRNDAGGMRTAQHPRSRGEYDRLVLKERRVAVEKLDDGGT